MPAPFELATWDESDHGFWGFRWYRLSGEWCFEERSGERWLRCQELPGKTRCEYYAPLRTSGLFRLFADIDPESESQILEFVTRWGPLGLFGAGSEIRTQKGLVRDVLPLHLRFFSTLEAKDDWQRELARMKAAVALYDAWKSGEPTGVSLTIQSARRSAKRYQGRVLTLNPERFSHHSPEVFVPAPPAIMDAPDRVRAYWVLADLINRNAVAEPLNCVVTPTFEDMEPKQMGFELSPDSLLGALWLQMAQAVSSNKEYRRCLECGIAFEISLEVTGYRRNRRYCSDACRMKASRSRTEKGRA